MFSSAQENPSDWELAHIATNTVLQVLGFGFLLHKCWDSNLTNSPEHEALLHDSEAGRCSKHSAGASGRNAMRLAPISELRPSEPAASTWMLRLRVNQLC